MYILLEKWKRISLCLEGLAAGQRKAYLKVEKYYSSHLLARDEMMINDIFK